LKLILLFFVALALPGFSQGDTTLVFSPASPAELNGWYPSETIALSREKGAISFSAYIAQPEFKRPVAFRTHGREGWSAWYELAAFQEGVTPGRSTFGPFVLATIFDSVQVRSRSAAVVFLRLFPLDAKHKHNNSSVTQQAQCSCDSVTSCSRSCWCPGGNCPTDASPVRQNPTHFIVHHTAGSSQGGAATVQAIWDFHVRTNGWDDIGYHYLIDPQGVVYEGRADSTIGAHFSCMNTGTIGIALLGNYQSAMPTAAAQQALENILAQRACTYQIPPADSSPHLASQLLLPHVAGHRHGNISSSGCPVGTLCPGDSLFSTLPALRQNLHTQPCLQGLNSPETPLPSVYYYPQPASDQLTIVAPDPGLFQVQLWDQAGRLVRQRAFRQMVHLPLQHLPVGLYVISLSAPHQLYPPQKIIVAR